MGAEEAARRPAAGERVYAIGDVHGRWDLLSPMLEAIDADDGARAPARTRILLLGDVIDRGPSSQRVVSHLMRLTRGSDRYVVLMGNHEHLMCKSLNGDLGALKGWLQVGGLDTLLSYGVTDPGVGAQREKRLLRSARRRVGVDVMVWLERLPLTVVSGDLVFVHAGIRPGVLLSAQSSRDLLSIRAPFTESEEERPFLVVHGHTVEADRPAIRRNRIGLDTGAYRTGRLTAMGFDGDERWVLST